MYTAKAAITTKRAFAARVIAGGGFSGLSATDVSENV
jgi:hypothetical protein